MPSAALTIADGRPDVRSLAEAIGSMSPGTVFSHRSAAWLHGLWIPPFQYLEVTTPATWRGSRFTTSVQRRTVVAHRGLLPPNDTTTESGLPVTTVGRTWIDLAALLDVHDLVAAGDAALRTGNVPADLAARVAGRPRGRGVVRARMAVPLLDRRSRSRPESRIRCALLLAGLPAPRVNEAVLDHHGGWLAEPDLHYAEAKVAVEYNGADHAGPDRMGKDSTRLLCLQRDGWEVRTYTAVDAFRRLDAVVADVRHLLTVRAPQLLARERVERNPLVSATRW
jgi:hypothetical protein